MWRINELGLGHRHFVRKLIKEWIWYRKAVKEVAKMNRVTFFVSKIFIFKWDYAYIVVRIKKVAIKKCFRLFLKVFNK